MKGTLHDRPDTGSEPVDYDRLLRSVVVNATDAVIIALAPEPFVDVRIVYVNPAFSRLTGYEPQDVLGKSPRLLQGPDSSPESRAQIREAIAQQRAVTVDLINYRKDGSPYLVEIALSPLIEEGRPCTHWIAIERDITERRRPDETLGRERRAEEKYQALLVEIAERERVEAKLAYKAVHDDLTGLYNRAYFMERLESAIARAAAEPDYRFSIVYLDLDRFKAINDYVGHRMGDRILRDLARRFRTVGGLARYARPDRRRRFRVAHRRAGRYR